MKKIMLFILVCFMCGCSSKVSKPVIDKAEEVCKDKKGIHQINTFYLYQVECGDGTLNNISFK